MKKRGGFKAFEIAILLLPVVLLAAVAVVSSRARMINRHMRTSSGLLWFRHPRDFVVAFVALQAFSFVIIVLVLFLQTMIDRVAPPFEKPGDD